MKFRRNPSIGSPADACGQTDRLSLISVHLFSVSSNNKTGLGLHVKSPSFLPDLIKRVFSRHFHKGCVFFDCAA